MDNYALAQENARLYFLSYDQSVMESRPGVIFQEGEITLSFLGYPAGVNRKTGQVTVCFPSGAYRNANFGEALSVYDWLCDQKPGAAASLEYCPVHSLPGVMVRGKGLSMSGGKLGAFFDAHPEKLRKSCIALGGTPVDLGDIGYKVPIFPDLYVLIKFYHSDEDFPPSVTLLWDKNILNFIKYETVYYVAGCLLDRLRELSGCKE